MQAATPARSRSELTGVSSGGFTDHGEKTTIMTNSIEDTAGLVSIGHLAKAAGVSSRTIRYYEELGILPEPHRSPGGTRKYPSDYQAYIEAALALKALGFRLEEIRPLARLALGRSISAGQRHTAARLVDGRIEELARQVSVLHRLRDSVREAGPAGTAGRPGARTGQVALSAVPPLLGDGAA
jgi:DNA-binding transcriptional MerR regulator